MDEQLTIPSRFQGVQGKGQGGHAAGLLAEHIRGPATADFFVPIPLDRPLQLRGDDARLELLDGDALVLRVRARGENLAVPDPVTVADAADAQRRSPVWDHPMVSDCYSCGTVPGTMEVHPGPLTGKPGYATTWTPPEWAGDGAGQVLPRHVWAAIDCPAGWCAGMQDGGRFRPAVTGSMTVQVLGQVPMGLTYAISAWTEPWKGRRVSAGTALFDATGRCLAVSSSVWIALPD